MKKLLSLCLLLLTTIAGWAQDLEPTTFTVGNFKYTVTDAENNYVSVVKADEFSFSEDLVIPSSVTYETVTYAVTAVGYEGFIGTGITSVTIPASVMSVGNHAFYDCDGLIAITIEDSETALQWNGTGYHPLDQVNSNYTLYLGRDLTTEGNQCFFPGATSVEIGDQMTTVNPYLFDGANKLASVTMGSGVTTIGDYAFQNTGTDESVTAQSIALGANVITIGDYAFSGCNKLTTLDLGTTLTAIPENMLFGCSALTGITIPASVQSVGAHAFYDCDGLTSITIEDSETALQWNGTGYHPLDQVNSNYTLYLGRDLTTEGNQCFFPGATSVEIGDQMTTVNPYLFDGANKLASVTMGSGVTTIGDYAFQNTGTDESVTAQSIALGANVITIGDYAFSGCNKLTTLALGRKLTAIPENMLFGCSALTGITIPASVQSVGAHAFYDCDGLTAITIEDSETALQWNGTSYHPLDQVNSNYTLYLGRDLTTEGNQCFFPGATSVEIGDQMTTVNPYLFDGANKLASVTMGSGVTTIGDYAFQNTGTDESVTAQSIALGANVITIGDYAFSGCNKLTTLALGRKLTAIPENMLFGCSALTGITIPASVQSVGAHAFYDCDGLTSITIEDSETALQWNGTDYHPLDQVNSNYTLYLGRNLTTEADQCFFPGATSVEIGDQMTTVNPHLFEGATKLANVTMGSGVTTIGEYAFQNTGTDESVTAQSISLGANVTTIGEGAFYNCSKLTTIDLGTSLTAIPAYMLYNCIALTSITIPASVQSVGSQAFYNCDGLTSITIEDSETALQWNGTDYHPFDQVNSNYTLYLGRNLTTADNWCFFPGATSVEFGPQVTAIPNYLFSEVELSSVKVPWLTPITLNKETFSDETYSNATLWIPGGTMDAYEEADGWLNFVNMDFASFVVSITGSAHGTLAVADISSTNNETATTLIDRETDAVFTVTPATGYKLSTFTVNSEAKTPTEGQYTVSNLLVDQTVVAGFTAINYTLNYELAGGSVASANPVSYTIESAAITLNNPTREGYNFAGWKLNGEGEAMMEVTIAAGSTGNKAYTATWQINQYTIVFDKNDGSETSSITQDYATEVETPATPERTGYTFAGWLPEVPSTIPAENTICVAQWSINKYTITFNTDGGSAIDPITQDYATTVTAPAVPTRDGYTFAGWDKDIPTTIPAENVTITATWTPVNYTISYELDGGSVDGNNPASYTIESAPITLINPTKSGYDFAGWTGTELDEATKTVTIATGCTGNRSYTATWTKTVYSVSITGAGVTADKTNPEYGESVTITIEPDEDRTLNKLTVNDVDVTKGVVDGQYTITSVTGNVVVVATFNSTKEFITLPQGVGTFSCSQDLNFTGYELKAYIAAGYNKAENQVLLVRVYDVPAGTGLYLKGEAGETYKIPYTTSQSYYVNMLKANLTASRIAKAEGEMSNFLLGKVDGVYKFCAPSESATLGAQKAYLQVPTSFVPVSEAARAISIAFEDDETTNISDFELFTNSNEHLYNLKGQRIEKAGRGIYIKNGKKVVLK